jgi:hypothetical protein
MANVGLIEETKLSGKNIDFYFTSWIGLTAIVMLLLLL